MLHTGPAGPAGWPLYIIGMLLVLVGLGFIAGSSGNAAVSPEDGQIGGGGAMASVLEVSDAKLAGAPAAALAPSALTQPASSSSLNMAKVLPELMTPELATLAYREREISRSVSNLLAPSPIASRMPTPNAMIRATNDLVQLRRTLDSLSTPNSVNNSSNTSAVRGTPQSLPPGHHKPGGRSGRRGAFWPRGSNGISPCADGSRSSSKSASNSVTPMQLQDVDESVEGAILTGTGEAPRSASRPHYAAPLNRLH